MMRELDREMALRARNGTWPSGETLRRAAAGRAAARKENSLVDWWGAEVQVAKLERAATVYASFGVELLVWRAMVG